MVGRGGFVLRAVPAWRRSLDQVAVHAREWDRRGAAVLAAGPGGPLWVVLGDSVAQGVGVADLADGYVERVRLLLERRDGVPWRVLNLSRSGAVVAELLSDQLPRLAALRASGWRPDLVTALVGGNDLRRTGLPVLLEQVRALVAAVPPGTAVATFPQGLSRRRAEPANALLRQLAAQRGLPVVDLQAATGPPYRGRYADGLHPNALGTTAWVAALSTALGLDPPEH